MRPAFRLALLLCTALPLAAQWNDSDRDRRGGVSGRIFLFADPNYEGEGVEILPGDDFSDLRQIAFPSGRAVNDRVSSIRIEGRASLRVYADPNFNGERLDITGDVPDLRRLARSKDGRLSWDDCITALRADGQRREPDRPRPPSRHDDRRDPPRIVLYADPNFEGEGLAIEAGDDLPDLRRAPFGNGMKSNDKVSSIRVERGAKARLYADPNFNGDALQVNESIADLRQLRRGQWTWDDCISAVRVDRAVGGRPPGQDRPGGGRPPGRDPESLIRQIYRELLGREPDRDTLREYRERFLEENWNEAMLRAAVTGSLEYRNREADRIIRRLYRELLDRDPDPTGFENYRRKMVDWSWSEDDVRRAIQRSDEYRRRGANPPPHRPPPNVGHRPREADETTGSATAPAQP